MRNRSLSTARLSLFALTAVACGPTTSVGDLKETLDMPSATPTIAAPPASTQVASATTQVPPPPTSTTGAAPSVVTTGTALPLTSPSLTTAVASQTEPNPSVTASAAGTIVETEDAEAPSASANFPDAAAPDYPTVTFDPPGGVPWNPPLAVVSEGECVVQYSGMITESSQTSGVSRTETWTYDASTTTLSRNSTEYVFNPQGRLLLFGDLIQYERDSHGNMTKRTSGNNTGQFPLSYDTDDRLAVSDDVFADWPSPSGASLLRRTYEYDSVGRCLAAWYGENMREIYFYDDQDRVMRRELRDGESLLGVAHYVYNDAGLAALIEDGWNLANSTAPVDGLADHIVRRAPDGAGGFSIEELYFSLATADRNRPYGGYREYELPWYPIDSNATVQRAGETTSVSRSEIRVSAECLQLGLPQRSPTSDLCTFDHAKPGLPFGWL